MIPLSQSLLLRNYPPEKRNIALALWSMTVIIAPIFGPIIGGYICDNYDWGWIFLINVPFGIIVVAITAWMLKGRETPTEPVKINLFALSLLVLGVGSLQIMLDKGKDLDWFSSTTVIVLAVIAVVALILLIIWEATNDNPIINLSLFRSRNFSIGVLCTSCAYLIYAGAIVLMPQLLQTVFDYTSVWAGLAYAPIGLMPLLIAPLIGRYGDRVDMRVLVTFSFIVYAGCYYWRAMTFNPAIDFTAVVLPQLMQGFAVACFFLPLTTISLSGLAPEKFAAATSLSNFFRTLSGSNRHVTHHDPVEPPGVISPCAADAVSDAIQPGCDQPGSPSAKSGVQSAASRDLYQQSNYPTEPADVGQRYFLSLCRGVPDADPTGVVRQTPV